jgi:hypothetical protein
MRLADPHPGLCSICFNSVTGDEILVDTGGSVDRGVSLNEHGGVAESIDNVFICKPCVQQACDVADVTPQALSDLERQVELLARERDMWKDYARKAEELMVERPIAKRPVGRPRKVAA